MFSFSQISWDEGKKPLRYCLMDLISQCFAVFQAEHLVFASIQIHPLQRRLFLDHTQLIANASNEVIIVKHILKSIPKNVVLGNYTIC